jgi:hypothetical protein
MSKKPAQGPRPDAISAEAAAAAAARSANPDLELLQSVAAELGISQKLQPITPPGKTPEEIEDERLAAEEAAAAAAANKTPEELEAERLAAEEAAAAAAASKTPEQLEAERLAAEEAAAAAAAAAAAPPDPIAEIKTTLASLQEAIAALRAGQATPPAPAPAPAPPPPPASVSDRIALAGSQEEIERIREEYTEILARCIEEPDGFEITPRGEQPRVLEPAEVRKLHAESIRALNQIPTRIRELEQTSQIDGKALELYPSFSDPNSTESQLYSSILRLAPQLRRLPNLRLIVGDAVAHEKTRLRTAPAGTLKVGPDGRPLPGTPRPALTKPPPVPMPPARGPAGPVTGDIARQQKLWRRQVAQGGEENLANLVETMLPPRRKSA